MLEQAREIAREHFRENVPTLVICHADGDGISSGALMYMGLWRMGCDVDFLIIHDLSEPVIEKIRRKMNEGYHRAVFCDFGAGNESVIAREFPNYVILDHHEPEVWVSERHLNPIFHGINDMTECSGSVTCFLLIYSLFDKEFWDTVWGRKIAALAVLGAVADLQNVKYGRLIGLNRDVLVFAKEIGAVDFWEDIGIYGRYTKPLPVAIAHHSPKLPEPLSDPSKCAAWLISKGFKIYEEENGHRYWRRLKDLSEEEKKRLLEELEVFLATSVNNEDEFVEYVESLRNEVYELTVYKGSELEKFSLDPRELATFLNSCTRQSDYETAFSLLWGDIVAVEKAMKNYRLYRSLIREALEAVRSGFVKPQYYNNFVFYNFANMINEKVTGVIATKLMKRELKNRRIPHVVAAYHTDPAMRGMVKISFRAPLELSEKNLNVGKFFAGLKEIFRKIDPRVDGGGHKAACAITIPIKYLPKVLELLDEYLSSVLE